MILGAITNSWAEHIFTADLLRLVARVQRRGAGHIELRQSFLALYEEGEGDEWRPVKDKLARLVRTFPLLTFNLAVAYPCLTRDSDPDAPKFQASLEVAKVVGSATTPRLRLVDTAAFEEPWEKSGDLPSAALGVAELAREAARNGVHLCIENAGQPIRSMGLLVREARRSMPENEASCLGLCVDPINSMRADPDGDPIAEIEALPPDYISMVHFKQTRDGQPHPSVDDGDLDYLRLLRVLKDKGYEGLAILEIPPTERAFDNFGESVEYLGRLMGSA